MLEELDAAIVLLPGDLDTLEARYPQGADPDIDELIGGLDTHLSTLVRIRAWVAGQDEAETTRREDRR